MRSPGQDRSRRVLELAYLLYFQQQFRQWREVEIAFQQRWQRSEQTVGLDEQ
jgi:hypothetical protein